MTRTSARNAAAAARRDPHATAGARDTPLDGAERASLRAIIDYAMPSEHRDFEEQDREGQQHHIYRDLLRLRAYLDRTETPANHPVAIPTPRAVTVRALACDLTVIIQAGGGNLPMAMSADPAGTSYRHVSGFSLEDTTSDVFAAFAGCLNPMPAPLHFPAIEQDPVNLLVLWPQT